MPGLETNRLQLRMFTMDDLDEMALIFGDAEVIKHLGSGKPATREESQTALLSIIRHWERHGFGRWAVVDKQAQKLIGYGGLRSFDGEPELVYLLAKPYWGRGLATEIARACLKYGFEERGFESIIALVKTTNAASQHVIEKIGMGFEKPLHVFGMDVFRYCISRAAYLSEQTRRTSAPRDYCLIPQSGAYNTVSSI